MIHNLSSSLWHLQQQGLFCDTVLVAQDGIEIPVHAVVLAAFSSQMFTALCQQLSADSCMRPYRIYLINFNKDQLTAVLAYVYTGSRAELMKCSSTTGDTDVLDVCKHFGISLTAPQTTGRQQSKAAAYIERAASSQNASQSTAVVDGNQQSSPGPGGSDTCQLLVNNINPKSKKKLHKNSISGKNSNFSQKSREAERKKPTERQASGTASKDSDMCDKASTERMGNEQLAADGTSWVTLHNLSAGDNVSETFIVSLDSWKTAKIPSEDSQCSTVFRCDVCLGVFDSEFSLSIHSKTHETDKDSCVKADSSALCQTPLSSKSSLTCVSCNKTFSSEQELSCHTAALHAVERNFVCDICHRGFIFAAHLRRHKAWHDEPRLACGECGSQFLRQTELMKHKVKHTGLWPASCDICGCGFLSSRALAEHTGVAHGANRPHACQVCGRKFVRVESLRRHARVHGKNYGRRMFKCSFCAKSFSCASYLRNHEALHNGGSRPYVCDICGKGFLGSSNLTTHRRIHTGERPYACSVCNKGFLQLCAVREHEKIHVGLKQFVCDVCGKQFMTSAQLYNHTRIHGGVKSFKCDVCQKQFYTNGDLVKHARIHADRRPFVCDVCGKGFKYSGNLRGHARTHTGSRPYVCKTCGKGFTYSSHLNRHAKLHKRQKADDALLTATAVDNKLPAATNIAAAVFEPRQEPMTTTTILLSVDSSLVFHGQNFTFPVIPTLSEHPSH